MESIGEIKRGRRQVEVRAIPSSAMLLLMSVDAVQKTQCREKSLRSPRSSLGPSNNNGRKED